MQLRPYQADALHAVRDAYRRGHRSALCVMPTGTGKTVLFAEVARLAKGPVLVVAHRQELVEQARQKIAAWCDDVVAVEMADRRELTAPRGRRPKITVASIQSLAQRLARIPRDAFRIVVIDEAHHATAETYRRLIDHFDAHVLGVTATPDRSDRQALGAVFAELAFDYGMVEAIRDGWLCPVRSFVVQTEVDFSGVRKVAGELQTADVERILTREPHLAELAHPILRERGGRPAMVFAASVAHARALARVLCALAGEPGFAVALDGSSRSDVRRGVIDAFVAGRTKVLVNCALFTEGFDVPQIALVAIARPVLSRSFYAQMVGRGTRLAPGKRDVLVLDFVPGNCRHALVHAVDIFADDPEVADRARRIAAAASAEGEALAVEQALMLAQQEVESRRASVGYRLVQRDPFAMVDIDAARIRRRFGGGSSATDEQVAWLRKAGVPVAMARGMSGREAYEMREELLNRRAGGLCNFKQAMRLADVGIDPRHACFELADEVLRALRRGKGRPVEDLRAECRRMGARFFDEFSDGGGGGDWNRSAEA